MSDRVGKRTQKTAGEPASLPNLDCLYERHPGLTQNICQALAEAAHVCLSRHHNPPKSLHVSRGNPGYSSRQYVIDWPTVTQQQRAAWANTDDATRDGAYAVSLAVLECEQQLFAISRAETRTGADYYVNSSGESDDLESAYKLEVSGTDHGDIKRRLKRKAEQAACGKSKLPALACVVGFKEAMVAIGEVEYQE